MLVALLVLGVMVTGPTHAQPTETVTEIRMDRRPASPMSQPAYHVTLRPDGTLIYDGFTAKHNGIWQAHISRWRFDVLSQLINRSHPNEFKARGYLTDLGYSSVSVQTGSTTWRLRESGDGPKAWQLIEGEIEATIRSAKSWKRLRKPTSKWSFSGESDTWAHPKR